MGVDLSRDMLDEARAKARAAGLQVEFIEADAEAWEPPLQAFDFVLAGYLPKYVAMDRWVPRAARALRPGGVLLAYDFTYPTLPPARLGWESWWSFLGPRLEARSSWREVARDLPRVVRETRWVEGLVEELPIHGLVNVRVHTWCFGAATLVEARAGGLRARSPIPVPALDALPAELQPKPAKVGAP